MKEILRHGSKYAIYRITCKCGCCFTYETEDIIGYCNEMPWVRCPECDACCEHYDAEEVL